MMAKWWRNLSTSSLEYISGVATSDNPWWKRQTKARFPLGEFVRATRSENKNPATWLVKIGWRKKSPRTSRKRSYVFVCSREQIRFNRLVENGLKASDAIQSGFVLI